MNSPLQLGGLPKIAKIKLVALDLDGTVTCPQGKNPISDKTSSSIRSLQEKGVFVTFVTGRAEEYAVSIAQELNILVPMVTYNGAHIYCPVQKRTLQETHISPSILPELLGWLDSSRVVMAAYWQSPSGLRLAQNRSSGSKSVDDYLFGSSRQVVGSLLADHDKHQEENLSKIILASKSSLEEVLEQMFKGSIQVIRTHEDLLEIIPYGVSKGSGLSKLCQLLTIELGSVLAIGDQENDISSFQVSGYSVAMGDAPASVKLAAQWVTGSFKEDGVAQVLEELIR